MQTVVRASVLVLGSLVLGPAARAQTDESGSVRDSVYTVEQAERGKRVYNDVCIACHIPEWFAGTFLESWNGATVSALYDLISTTMPEDRPGGLGEREYADVVAYIFAMNGLPAGSTELKSKKHILDRIIIEWRE